MAGIGYSPYTGAGNLASAFGANPNFGGSVGGYGGGTGGYQSGGYQYPNNVGGVNYSGAAPSGYAWGATGLVPIGTGAAGIQAYNPAISTSPTRSFQAPTFTNSMSSWYPGGNANMSQISAMTPSSSGDFQAPSGMSERSIEAMAAEAGYGMGGSSGYSPLGTAAANAAAWPNPNVSMSATPSNRYTTQNIMAGLFGGEDPNNTTGNPYQMMPSAMAALRQWGTPMPAPTNPQASYNAANAFISGLQRNYNLPYAEQVATAYGPSGISNVNRNYNPNIPGSTPYLNNVSQNAAGNQTPQAYLYGNPATSYGGVMAGMRGSAGQDAVTSQFQQAAGAGQQPWQGASGGGRY